jgi:hypothetical protein
MTSILGTLSIFLDYSEPLSRIQVAYRRSSRHTSHARAVRENLSCPSRAPRSSSIFCANAERSTWTTGMSSGRSLMTGYLSLGIGMRLCWEMRTGEWSFIPRGGVLMELFAGIRKASPPPRERRGTSSCWRHHACLLHVHYMILLQFYQVMGTIVRFVPGQMVPTPTFLGAFLWTAFLPFLSTVILHCINTSCNVECIKYVRVMVPVVIVLKRKRSASIRKI